MSEDRLTTISTLPPPIMGFFDPNMLKNIPDDIFRDSARRFYEMYEWVKVKLIYKARNNPKRLEKCLELERQFCELYVRAKAKEKEIKEKTGHEPKEPFYYTRLASQKDECLFGRFDHKKIRSI